ncbi:transforming acidic coiled-coil-containing protein 2 isoform X2 [Trichomycterus rosablanca]|uniref:transforming acidic coiled-coil-containing protein 2 isoform X2 n=1 Tax=Trichomycterus rosablanca TaxID=2290929 RepID=UPI002F34FD17
MGLGKAGDLDINKSSEPFETFSITQEEGKTEDNCFSAVISGNNKCPVVSSVRNGGMQASGNKVNQKKTDSQECKSSESPPVEFLPLETTELKPELQESSVTVKVLQEIESKHLDSTKESQATVNKPGELEDTISDHCKSVKLTINDSPEPLGNSSTSRHVEKTEDQCYNVFKWENSKCVEVSDVQTEGLLESSKQANQNKTENQELVDITTSLFENKDVKPELRESSVSVNILKQSGSELVDCTIEPQVCVAEPVNLNEAEADLCKAEVSQNDSSKPCINSNTPHTEIKTEDQCLSASTFDNKCPEVSETLRLNNEQKAGHTASSSDKQLTLMTSPILDSVLDKKVESEKVESAPQEWDNAGLTNKAQTYQTFLEPSHAQNKEWQDAVHPEAQHTDVQECITLMETVENPETSVSSEANQIEHEQEEINGCEEKKREDDVAESRKLVKMPESHESEQDIEKGTIKDLPDNFFSSAEKTVGDDTDLLASTCSDGLKSEKKQDSASEQLSNITHKDISMVSESQDPSQTLLGTKTQSSNDETKSFIQIMRERASEVSKTESENDFNSTDGEVSEVAQKEKTDGNKSTGCTSTNEEWAVTIGTCVSKEVSDSPGAAVDPIIELNPKKERPDTERSCESSDSLKALTQAAAISHTQQECKLGSADDRPFDRAQAEPEFHYPAEEGPTELKEQPEDPLDIRPQLTEAAEESEFDPDFPPPPEEHLLLSALPAHLFEVNAEFPTPPSTPPESPPIEPEPESVPVVFTACPSSDPDQVPSSPVLPLQFQHDQHPTARSSDSDGTFETPESTTPVKTASPQLPPPEQPEPSTEPLTVEDTEPCPPSTLTLDDSITDVLDPPLQRKSSRALSPVFDEDKPIASSGAYNLDHLLSSDSVLAPLTRSLSFQSGELDSINSGDRTEEGSFDIVTHLRSESFSVGTESAPGTLRRVKKPRPGSLKKKPLSRQNSNPESAERSGSSSSTPDVRKKGKPQTEGPSQEQEEKAGPCTSPSPSPAGTLRRTRIKSRVESPPPVAEESPPDPAPITTKPQEEAPSVPDEDSPIPLSASYQWDPDNFENIDPFCSGGSKIANSPVLGRKIDFAPSPQPTPVPTKELAASATLHSEKPLCPEEQPITKRSVRLEFDYSEKSGDTSQDTPLPPKKLGKKPGAKMPIRKPKLTNKKPAQLRTEQLDNVPAAGNSIDIDDIPIPKASCNFDPSKWDDPNFNPFSSAKDIPNSPGQSRASYSFNEESFDDSVDSFKTSIRMANSPPKPASFEVSSNDNENDNDNIDELDDHNQNKPAKNKKKPLKSNTFRVKKSPKRSPLSEQSAKVPQDRSNDTRTDHMQDLATDEEKLASSTNQKWTARHDVQMELTSDVQDFPQPSDLTAFVNESNLPTQNQDYEIEYMEKIGTNTPPLSVKKPFLYLNLDPVTDSPQQTLNMDQSGPNSPCTGSFEEMEAKISMEGKSPVVTSHETHEPPALVKSRQKESKSQSRAQSSERGRRGPADPTDLTLLDKLSESSVPLSYLEPDLAETNPTAFALKLQEELVLAALRIEALQVAQNISQSPTLSTVSPQVKEVASSGDSGVSKGSLYSRVGYSEAESPYLPRELDHSLGIAREEVVAKEKEVLEWQQKYEESRQELEEMKKIVAEYEKTIAQMIEDEQKEKSLSHHTIQQLILEKDQALADLNSVEKSLADLFRRYEKMKDVLDGFRKNEDVLKKCAQEYLSRVRKEEQRYQALKIHAEEKLDKANAEIAQVRTKAKQEQAAYQASLRKEQMKVDSLERTLEQKNKEIEELTKICDELIAKMGRS